MEDSGIIANRLHTGHHTEYSYTCRFYFDHVVEAVDHILCFHLLAVLELDTLAEVERPRLKVFADVPGLRQHRLNAQVRIVLDQRFIDLINDVNIRGVTYQVRIKGRVLGGHR